MTMQKSPGWRRLAARRRPSNQGAGPERLGAAPIAAEDGRTDQLSAIAWIDQQQLTALCERPIAVPHLQRGPGPSATFQRGVKNVRWWIGNCNGHENQHAGSSPVGGPSSARLFSRAPMMDVRDAADAVVDVASLSLHANVPSMTVMATVMPYIGRAAGARLAGGDGRLSAGSPVLLGLRVVARGYRSGEEAVAGMDRNRLARGKVKDVDGAAVHERERAVAAILHAPVGAAYGR